MDDTHWTFVQSPERHHEASGWQHMVKVQGAQSGRSLTRTPKGLLTIDGREGTDERAKRV